MAKLFIPTRTIRCLACKESNVTLINMSHHYAFTGPKLHLCTECFRKLKKDDEVKVVGEDKNVFLTVVEKKVLVLKTKDEKQGE